MTDEQQPTEVKEIFSDTCILFDYAISRRDQTYRLFKERDKVEKVASPRIKREFESVATRQQDIHRELLEFATSDQLKEYEPEAVGSQKNDLRYVVNLYSELLALDDEVEVVRRLNELVSRLEKAHGELFSEDGRVTIIEIDGSDAQLSGYLSGVVSNDADVRILCDAVAWRRSGGSGTFITADTDDILGKETTAGSIPSDSKTDDSGRTTDLSDNFEDFWSIDEKSLPQQINDQIKSRFGTDAVLTILSVSAYLDRLKSHESTN